MLVARRECSASSRRRHTHHRRSAGRVSTDFLGRSHVLRLPVTHCRPLSHRDSALLAISATLSELTVWEALFIILMHIEWMQDLQEIFAITRILYGRRWRESGDDLAARMFDCQPKVPEFNSAAAEFCFVALCVKQSNGKWVSAVSSGWCGAIPLCCLLCMVDFIVISVVLLWICRASKE